ncbi:MAG: hypothetical protein ACXAE3_07545 [Candidatus Kariarchaeaceae archaeon]|jgi:hypothetical protein
MAAKKKKKDEGSDDSEKKKVEFNLKDGVSWHDFAGVFVMIGLFFWRLFLLVISPVIWIYNENVRMIRFARATSHERVLTEDERFFVETIPFVYTVTGLIGGVLVGLIGWLSFGDTLREFFENLQLDFIAAFFNFIGSILKFIFVDIIFGLISAIANFFSWIGGIIFSAFTQSPFLALGGLLLIGVVIMLIYIAFAETGIAANIFYYVRKAFLWIIGSPDRFRMRVNSIYRRFNHRLTTLLVGKERVHTRTQVYFKKVVFYTIFLSLYSFAAGIFIASSPEDWGGFETFFQRIFFAAMVLFFAGVISGTLFFAFVARFLDLLNRAKYISPEFINDGVVDLDAMAKFTQEDEDRVQAMFKSEQEQIGQTEETTEEL